MSKAWGRIVLKGAWMAAIGGMCALALSSGLLQAEIAGRMVLEDFQAKGPNGLPKDWKAQNSEAKARDTYMLAAGEEAAFLSARKADQRIYKRNIDWNPKAAPTLTWRWRLKSAPASAEPIAAVFVSLDTDLMVIPVSNKYVWSATKAKGSVTDGGVFAASEIVVRSGLQPVGEWVEERVNVYEDFKKIHGHEPAAKAWGISLLGGPGVEVDFGPLTASAP